MKYSQKNRWIAILVVTLVTFMASVVLTVIQPMEYRSEFTVLVLDRDPDLDGYAAAKSAERLSQSLAQAVATSSFADQVYVQLKEQSSLKSNAIISADAQVRRDEWAKRIEAQAIPDVGQVKVSVYQQDRSQAETIATALSIAVVGLGGDYLGGNANLQLKIVDSPLTSKTPVRPNIFANLGIGLILGFGGSVAFFTLFGSAAAPANYAPMFLTMPQTVPPEEVKEQKKKTAKIAFDPELHIPSGNPRDHSIPIPDRHQNQSSHKPISSDNQKPEVPDNLPVLDEWPMP